VALREETSSGWVTPFSCLVGKWLLAMVDNGHKKENKGARKRKQIGRRRGGGEGRG
jgi:hypothetical protein